MIHIAIADDLAADRLMLKKALMSGLSKYKIEYDITEFENGTDFIQGYKKNPFQIVFLDIYMDDMNGIDVARQFYHPNTKCKLIFLTSSTEHITRSFALKATCYLLKPVKQSDLRQALALCFPQKNEGEVFPIMTGKSTHLISRDKIIYIEHLNRCTHIHTGEKTWKSYISFKEVIAPLTDDPHFFICHRGILVNIIHIEQQIDNDFLMQSGSMLPISRKLKKTVLDTWQHYKLDNMWCNI